MENEINDDEAYEEEELLVFANFEDGTIDRSIFLEPDIKFKAIGLDSDTPVVQLGDTTFKGTWNDSIGTKVIFEEDSSPEQVDPVFTVVPSKMLKYKCMTTKILDLSRIFLKPKNPEMDLKSVESAQTDEENSILQMAECTVSSDLYTDDVMREIVEDSTLDITDQDMIE